MLELPPAPTSQTGPVKAWSQPVLIPTYEPLPADRNPMFLDRRVYQGSSGRVYPLPFTDRISTERSDRWWRAVHLENEYVRLMILPDIGGRIHVGLDKTNGYDFFYRQNVIKPALVGLAGPWISGGVEFNWPQHHRPATFMPVDFEIETAADNSKTVWCSDHDPINRLKGMHGVCLKPGSACVELKVRLYNRTAFLQTFLWWANVAVHVHEEYQSFFPPDVHYVADHAKRAISSFPLCTGSYYGIDYASRASNGVPANELPRKFVPDGSYPANDLSWYANIPVPTSYMAMGSERDFSGGYDHARHAGVLHIANHNISPGKKQWTWGNHEFGYAWDSHLTDQDGPYIELMAGVYTDNQPDFSFLAPGETKTFRQFWYPFKEIGPVQAANTEAAVSLKIDAGIARVGVSTTRSYPATRIELQFSGKPVLEWIADLSPRTPFRTEAPFGGDPSQATIRVQGSDGRELIRYTPLPQATNKAPAAATEPALPADVASNDELYLIGLHLEQYRHATRYPEAYWREALRRDPGDARSNHALGRWHLRRGQFDLAVKFLQASIARLTSRNPNPADGEPFYDLGVALRFWGRDDEAYASFYKATWNFGWRAPAYYALAEIDASRGAFEEALQHLSACLRVNADHSNARNLSVVILRKLGRDTEASALLQESLGLDRLDYWARFLNNQPLADNRVRIDIALDLMRSGLLSEAKSLLAAADLTLRDGSVPMILYCIGYIALLSGDELESGAWFSRASAFPADYCFPSRLEELVVFRRVLKERPDDARAHYYTGNLLYDRRRGEEAIAHWKRSSELDPKLPVVWRNLGIALFNVVGDVEKARYAFEQAIRANPQDARLLYERDQLWKRTGAGHQHRFSELTRKLKLVESRDDLTVELASLYNHAGRHAEAAALLATRKFQPWEGGEGMVLAEFVRTQLALGRQALVDGDHTRALRVLEAALAPPSNLGETWHLLANRSNVYYWLGVVCQTAEDLGAAAHWWNKAAVSSGDFQEMSVQQYSEMTYYSCRALIKLGKVSEANERLRSLLRYAREMKCATARIDYFATSLPAMLLFNDDLQKRNTVNAMMLEAQASLGLGYTRRGRALLRRILDLDPNHALATDTMAELEMEKRLRGRVTAQA